MDSARNSLFVYQPDQNWDAFYDPYFTPSYKPPFSNSELEERAKEVCGNDTFCLFDIAATGNVDVGVATLESTKIIDEIYSFLLPGIYCVCEYKTAFCFCIYMYYTLKFHLSLPYYSCLQSTL